MKEKSDIYEPIIRLEREGAMLQKALENNKHSSKIVMESPNTLDFHALTEL